MNVFIFHSLLTSLSLISSIRSTTMAACFSHCMSSQCFPFLSHVRACPVSCWYFGHLKRCSVVSSVSLHMMHSRSSPRGKFAFVSTMLSFSFMIVATSFMLSLRMYSSASIFFRVFFYLSFFIFYCCCCFFFVAPHFCCMFPECIRVKPPLPFESFQLFRLLLMLLVFV